MCVTWIWIKFKNCLSTFYRMFHYVYRISITFDKISRLNSFLSFTVTYKLVNHPTPKPNLLWVSCRELSDMPQSLARLTVTVSSISLMSGVWRTESSLLFPSPVSLSNRLTYTPSPTSSVLPVIVHACHYFHHRGLVQQEGPRALWGCGSVSLSDNMSSVHVCDKRVYASVHGSVCMWKIKMDYSSRRWRDVYIRPLFSPGNY